MLPPTPYESGFLLYCSSASAGIPVRLHEGLQTQAATAVLGNEAEHFPPAQLQRGCLDTDEEAAVASAKHE